MITITDLFAGAGGSSTGAIQVAGVTVRAASNHWQLAVDTHNENHPDTDHICADISQISPRCFPTTDILWASPECTNHSKARGRKRETGQPDLFGETLPDEAAERSRATMWDVPRFTEYHRYRHVIVENVVEAVQWEPFKAWLMSMDCLGYEHHIVYLNSMHAQALGLPAPQSRDRIYVHFWRKGSPRPDFDRWQRPEAWCPSCSEVIASVQSWKRPDRPWGRYRSQYVYRCPKHSCRGQIVEPGWLPASAAIDWSMPGHRIGDRDKPLADKTRRRIAAGIARYWTPVHLEAAGHTYDAADPKHLNYGDPNAYYRAWPIDEPLKTLHTIESKAVACPPLVTRHYGIEGGNPARHTKPTDEALRTLTCNGGNMSLLQAPFIAELRGGGSTARPTSHPLSTVTASGFHHGLVSPYYGNSDTAHSTDAALGTLTTRDRYALIMRNNNGGAEMSTPAHEVMRTLTTKGHQSLLTPGDLAAAEAQVDDCLFRMLEPTETAAGMAFPGDYRWRGTRRERQKMAGNAVTPPAGRDQIGCAVEALAGAA